MPRIASKQLRQNSMSCYIFCKSYIECNNFLDEQPLPTVAKAGFFKNHINLVPKQKKSAAFDCEFLEFIYTGAAQPRATFRFKPSFRP
jgi:hypothetical protein